MASRSFGSRKPAKPHLLRTKGMGGEIADLRRDVDEAFQELEESVAELPTNSTVLIPSGDTTGFTDRTALQAILTAGRIAILQSTESYYDDGVALTWHVNARILTSDDRPAFWRKGSLATTAMSALPGCISITGAVLTMTLPNAVNWPEQYATCQITIASTLTVAAPAGHTLGEALTTMPVGGVNNRLVVASHGTTTLIPIAEGPPQSFGWFGESLKSPFGALSLQPGKLANDGTLELGNFEFVFGAQRGPAFTQGSAIFFKFAPTGANLVDIQTFGSGSATGVSYIRWGHSIGRRDQQTGVNQPYIIQPQASGAHIIVELGAGTTTDFWVTAAGATGAVQNILVDGDGSVVIAAVATQELELRSGATKRIEINGTGLGFNGSAPIAKPTGVAVDVAAIHAALVSYGLISA